MKVAISLGIHSSIEALIEKTGGNLDRVSEFVLIDKCSREFDETFVFTSDKKSFQGVLPRNCRHVPIGGRLTYLLISWFIILRYSIREGIKIIFIEGGTALPSIFLVNRFTRLKTILNYNYLWHITYFSDKRKKKLTKRIRNNRPIAYLFKIMEKTLLFFVDYIIASSREIRVFAGKKKIVEVKKGIILRNFDREKTKKSPVYSKIKGPAIIFSGRLVPVKNPLLLIDAYKTAKKEIPDLNLIICGDGELMEECRKAADRDVHLLGFVDDIPGLYRGADIFVSTSDYDASPRSLMEAMAMGLPCISTNVGGVPDYMDDSCGVLIEPNNPNILAEKIVYILKNKEKAKHLGRRARQRMLENHDLEKNLDRIISFMKDAS